MSSNSKKMTDVPIETVGSDIHGFLTLAKAFHLINSTKTPKVRLIMPRWFDANMMAILGGLASTIKDQGRQLSVRWNNPDSDKDRVRQVALKNGFMQKVGFGNDKVADDTHETTIRYDEFALNDEEKFSRYTEKHFLPTQQRFFNTNEKLAKEIGKNIVELFTNASDHSESNLGIFACGQVYPREKHLDFTIFDLGIGITQKIKQEIGLDFPKPDDAFKWALAYGNTTRKGSYGGEGLHYLKETIRLNKGHILFASHGGVFSINDGNTEKFSSLKYPLPGTAISIRFMIDGNIYILSDD